MFNDFDDAVFDALEAADELPVPEEAQPVNAVAVSAAANKTDTSFFISNFHPINYFCLFLFLRFWKKV